MDGLGFLSLGASAGLVTSLILAKGRTPLGIGSMLGALSPVLLSGAAVLFSPQLSGAKGVGLFPLGLLLALLWEKNGAIVEVLDQPGPRRPSSVVFCFAIVVATILVMVKSLFA